MGWFIFFAVLVLAVWLLWKSKNNSALHASTTATSTKEITGKRVRLTNNQTVCLSCASYDKPIYGENPSHMYSQMPNDAHCFSLKTVESLEKRGYLVCDGKGGYLITDEGMHGLRSAMGF